MAAKLKIDPLEDAQFRMDDHERKLGEIERALSPEVIAALVHGAVAACSAQSEQQLAKILSNQAKDIDTDERVVAKLEELIALLSRPETSTCRLELPSGPVTMTVTKRRE